MNTKAIRYWGNSPLWREQIAPWKKYYYFSCWHLNGGAYISHLKDRRGDITNALRLRYKVAQRGDWVLLTPDMVTIYSNDEYQQLLEV